MNFRDIFSNKEFIFTGRILSNTTKAPQTYLSRTILLLILFFFMVPFSASDPSSGLSFFRFLISLNFIYATFYACNTFASVISNEKEQGTLGLLMLTPRHPISIIAAKVIPPFTEVLFTFLIELPLLLICIALGGIDSEQIYQIIILLPIHTFFIMGVGVFFSNLLNSSKAAFSATFLCVVAFYFIPITIDQIFKILGPAYPNLGLHEKLKFTNTTYLLFDILRFKDCWELIGYFAIFSFISTTFLIFISLKILERTNLTTSIKSTSNSKGKNSVNRIRRAWKTAIVGKDFHASGGKRFLILKVISYPLISLALIYAISDLKQSNLEDILSFLALIHLCAAAMEILLYASQTFFNEVKQTQLSSLQMLPISNYQKIKAIFIQSCVPMIYAFCYCIISPKNILSVFSAFSKPQTYILIAFFSFLFITFIFNGLLGKVKKNIQDQLLMAFWGFMGYMIVVLPIVMLFNDYPEGCAIFACTIAILYIKIIIDKIDEWMTTLAQQEN